MNKPLPRLHNLYDVWYSTGDQTARWAIQWLPRALPKCQYKQTDVYHSRPTCLLPHLLWCLLPVNSVVKTSTRANRNVRNEISGHRNHGFKLSNLSISIYSKWSVSLRFCDWNNVCIFCLHHAQCMPLPFHLSPFNLPNIISWKVKNMKPRLFK
jgi:hypothetical protein